METVTITKEVQAHVLESLSLLLNVNVADGNTEDVEYYKWLTAQVRGTDSTPYDIAEKRIAEAAKAKREWNNR